MRLSTSTLMALLLTGCVNSGGTARNQAAGPVLPEPAYGPVIELIGIVERRFEAQAFSICTDPSCHEMAPPSEACWFIGTKEYHTELRDLSGGLVVRRRNPQWYQRIRGRVARGGNFGHRNAYECQVEAQLLISVGPWNEDG